MEMIRQHKGLIFKVASLYTNDKEDRQDLVQEIIYQLWKAFDSFQEKSSRGTWMYRIAMNVAIYYSKKSKKTLYTIPINHETLNLIEFQKVPNQQWELLQTYIENLNLLEKGLLMLYLEEKSYAEIAEITGITETNVGTKLSRIKQKLRNEIAKRVK